MAYDFYYGFAEENKGNKDFISSLRDLIKQIRHENEEEKTVRDQTIYEQISQINALRKRNELKFSKAFHFEIDRENDRNLRLIKKPQQGYTNTITYSFIGEIRKNRANIVQTALALEFLARFHAEKLRQLFENNFQNSPPDEFWHFLPLPVISKKNTGFNKGKDSHPPSSEPPLYLPEQETLSQDKSNWLDPTVVDALPFVGRDKEMRTLNDFVLKEQGFGVWALSGPSGAGKTRLLNHWLHEFSEKSAFKSDGKRIWNFGFLNQIVKSNWNGDWSTWEPEFSTLIVIDYIHLFTADIRSLFARWGGSANTLPPKKSVRLLLVDHIFPDNLNELRRDPRFGGIIDSHVDLNKKRKLFFNERPLFLQKEQQSETDLQSIICRASDIFQADGEDKSLDKINLKAAIEHLENTEGAWCPLFAALKGYAIAKGELSDAFGNRRDLIDYYLDSSNRLPWKSLPEGMNPDEHGEWIGCLIAAASALRGVSYKKLYAQLPDAVQRDLHKHSDAILAYSCALISKPDTQNIGAFEPDIIGESFFLLVLKKVVGWSVLMDAFIALLCVKEGAKKTEKNAEEFLEFIRRMRRNLAKDTTLDVSREQYRTDLFELLQPALYPKESSMRGAVAVLMTDLFEQNTENDFQHVVSDRLEIEYFQPCARSRISGDLRVALITYWEQVDEEFRLNPDNQSHALSSYLGFEMQAVLQKGLITVANLDAISTIKLLTESGRSEFDVNFADSEGVTALISASLNGHTATVQLLLEKGAEINQATTNVGATALMAASLNGDPATVQLLLEKGAEINQATTDTGMIALFAASESGHTAAVQLLLENGAEINQVTTDTGENSLMAASKHGHRATVQLLLENGADINQATTNIGATSLMLASLNGDPATVQLLLENGAEINQATTDTGWTALLAACASGHTATVQLLLENGADINQATTDTGWTALLAACASGHTATVQLLLENGADINQATTNIGATALMLTCENGHMAIVQLLLNEGAEINLATTDTGWTALMAASLTGDTATVRLLLENGADTNQVRTDTGVTALMIASFNDHTEIARLLFDHGAQINMVDTEGSTALDYAEVEGSKELIALLLRSGANRGSQL
uniref:ankyrin repeat domain-containing protein n=1 Tax=Pararhizobium sp. IMCC3301 TaxID=3067904 RepID=UPI00274121D0|nr:ankyrin repeat domain-containing protein [Pararhizobium sp. IMCC3301]